MATQIMLRTHEDKYVFSDKNIRFLTALDLIKCLKQIKHQRWVLTCEPISGLLSNISTMI